MRCAASRFSADAVENLDAGRGPASLEGGLRQGFPGGEALRSDEISARASLPEHRAGGGGAVNTPWRELGRGHEPMSGAVCRAGCAAPTRRGNSTSPPEPKVKASGGEPMSGRSRAGAAHGGVAVAGWRGCARWSAGPLASRSVPDGSRPGRHRRRRCRRRPKISLARVSPSAPERQASRRPNRPRDGGRLDRACLIIRPPAGESQSARLIWTWRGDRRSHSPAAAAWSRPRCRRT